MISINPRTAPALYIGLMGVWMYGFAASDRRPPSVLVALLFLLPLALHVGVGYVVGRWEAVVLAAAPVVIAIAAAGLGSPLWIFVFLLMVFPGAPLIAAGVAARRWREEREEPDDDVFLL